MAWSPYFNVLFIHFQNTFIKIRETYPEIDKIFDENPKLFEDENALIPLYHLWKVNLLTIDEKNHDVGKKVCEILLAGKKDPQIFIAVTNIIEYLSEHEKLSPKNLGFFIKFQDHDLFKILSYMLYILDKDEVLNVNSFDRIFYLLQSSLMHLYYFQIIMHNSSEVFIPLQDRKFLWEGVIHLIEKGRRLYNKFISVVNSLDVYQAVTPDRLKIYITDIMQINEDDANGSVEKYLEDLSHQVVSFAFLNVDDSLRKKLLHHVKHINSVCESGISLDELALHLSQMPNQLQDEILNKLNSFNCELLHTLIQAKLLDSELIISLFTPNALESLGSIYKEIILQNLSRVDKLLIGLSDCVKNSAEFERDEKLRQFVLHVKNFSWLDYDDKITAYMADHRINVLRACQTGISIEALAKIHFFHKPIFENMSANNKSLLAYLYRHVNEAWFYMVLMNAVNITNDIANYFQKLHVLTDDESYWLSDMVDKLHIFMEDNPVSPASFKAFFAEYYQALQRVEIANVDSAIENETSSQSSAVSAGFFRASSNDSGYHSDDEGLSRSVSQSSFGSLEFN